MRTLISIGCALAMSVAAAQAADLPARVAAPAPVVVATVYNWTGFYIGANVGYGWAAGTVESLGLSADVGDLKGPFAGGQIGYNYQTGQFVWGIEADGQWANINQNYTALGLAFDDKVNYFFTVRGRLGVAMQNVLLYGTGGYAFGGWKSSVTNGVTTLSISDSRGGWTAGGGAEFGFGNWSAKLEYLYLQSFDKDETVFGNTVTWNVHVHTVKLGLNYRFGGGAPVTARY